jgi:hypothetical protein
MKAFTLALLLAALPALTADDPHAGHMAGGELKHGRYVGWIELEDAKERLALTADFFLESPEDFTQFPSLNALFKMSLGGYNTKEYVTEIFTDLRYDFDNGALTLDEPANDLVMTTEIHTMGSSTFIMGDVFIRSSAVSGKLYLKYDTDEPGDDEPGSDEPGAGDDEPGAEPEAPFVPLLEGQYEGLCGKERSVMQIQTVRGLKTLPQTEHESTGLTRYYGVVGRLGSRDSLYCKGAPKNVSCMVRNYEGGSYNLFQGKLLLTGATQTDECTLKQGRLQCQVRLSSETVSCDLKKAPVIEKALFHGRTFRLSPTADQTKELPAAAPPKNAALTAAVKGVFTGYLHNETTNRYQLLRLHSTPFSFTDNPHNPNQMMVSTTASLYLGGDASGPFITQRYEPRSFYIRPGFTLSGKSTDSFLAITDWKQGYVRGVWYSHAFGRVGTFELVKGAVPALPQGTKALRAFTGEFEGGNRWFRLNFPAQPNDLTDHLIRFTGSYQPLVGITATKNISAGAFDPYTGMLGWVIEKEDRTTFASGLVGDDGNAQVYWPPAPSVFGAQMHDFALEAYKRK